MESEASNFDEVFMKQSLLFSDSLNELNNLRKQLYSAAEYFELSYSKDDQKHLVVETLKDYAVKALINTVDHLGSVAYKFDSCLDEKIGEVSRTELRFSCIEQRLRTCQEFIDQGGLSQQSLVIKIPKYHKQYIIPVGKVTHAAGQTKPKYHSCSLDAQEDLHQFKKAVQATTLEPPLSLVRKGHSTLPSPQLSSRTGAFSFTRIASSKELEKRTVLPHLFPLNRSGSVVSRSTTLSSSDAKQRYPSEPQRSMSLCTHDERDKTKEIEQYSSKSKRLFKALLSMRKSKKDGTLYRYLDEN